MQYRAWATLSKDHEVFVAASELLTRSIPGLTMDSVRHCRARPWQEGHGTAGYVEEMISMADAAEQLVVTTRQDDDRAVLVLDGEFDLHTAPVVADSIDKALAAGPHLVELDASGLCFADSSALVTLLLARQRAHTFGAGLYVVRPSEPLARILKMTGLDQLLEATAHAQRS